MMGLLKFGQLFQDAARMVIVDQRDGAHDRRSRSGDATRDELVADEVAEGFRRLV